MVFGLKEISWTEAEIKEFEFRQKALELGKIHKCSDTNFATATIPLCYRELQPIKGRQISFHFKEELSCESPEELIDCIYSELQPDGSHRYYYCQHDPGDCPVYMGE